MSFTVQRTLVLPYPSQEVSTVTAALAKQANNLYNTAFFIIRNVISSYTYDASVGVLLQKDTLHTHQQQAVNAFNGVIQALNAKRLSIDPQAKQLPLFAWASNNLFTCLLDPTVLDQVCRNWATSHEDTVYSRLPGVMAQQVRRRVIDAFKSHFKAIEAYTAHPAAFTGKPRMPSYRNKGSQFVLEFPLAQLNGQGLLPSVVGKRVPVDYEETSLLTDEQLSRLQTLHLREEIEAAAKRRGLLNANPVHLRIVPGRRGQKLEVVVDCSIEYPTGSFLARVNAAEPDCMVGMSSKQKEEWLKRKLAKLPTDQIPRLAGLDFGLNNVVALGYSTGHKADVVAGSLLEKTLDRCYQRLSDFQSENSTARMRELQSLKTAAREKKQPFSKFLSNELNGLLRNMYAQPRYAQLQAELQNTIQNALHQLSSGIIDFLKDKKIDVLVVGLNKGWKTASDMSKDNRSRFGRIAHSRLLTLLRYKAEAIGVAVLSTEESYTSQASFVENEKLAPKKNKDNTNKSAVPASQLLKQNHRGETNRNWFHNVSRTDRWLRVHADVNGAFNMLRKVFKNFMYTDKMTLKFMCWQLSPSRKLLLQN